MIENLLWPKKLTEPPQLLVDLFALFNGKISIFNIPLIGEHGDNMTSGDRWTNYRLIDVSSDGSNTFRVGFVSEIIVGPPTYMVIITLPFQNISVSIDEYRCHGWDRPHAYTLSNPTETEVKKTLTNTPLVASEQGTSPNGHSSLFKMTGYELEGGGSGQQFSSNGSFVDIRYEFNSRYVNNLHNEFPQMWSKYQDELSQTLAVETVVKVKVYPGNTDYGFNVGIA